MYNQPYGYAQQPMYGYNYAGMNQQAVTKFNNVLTPEEYDTLVKDVGKFSLTFTKEEYLRGICNHRSKDGMDDTLTVDPVTGKVTCSVCGYEFKPVDTNSSPEEISAIVEDIINVLQTIKMVFIDLPADASRDYFQIIPLLEKVPKLFEFAMKNMAKHETTNSWQYGNNNEPYWGMFQNLQHFLNNGMNSYGYQQPGMNPAMAPQPGFAPQAPVAPQAPINPAMAPQPMMSNGFGYAGASQMPPQQPMGYQPQTAGFQYQPNAPVAPAPVAEATTTPPVETTTVDQKVEVK